MKKLLLCTLLFGASLTSFAQTGIGARINLSSWFITDVPDGTGLGVSLFQSGYGVNLFYQHTLSDAPHWRFGADLGLTFIPKSQDALISIDNEVDERGGFAIPIAGTIDYIWTPSSSFKFYTGIQLGVGMLNRTQDYSLTNSVWGDPDTSFSKSDFRVGFNYGFRVGGEFDLTDNLKGQVNLGYQFTYNKSTYENLGVQLTWPTVFGSYYLQAGVVYPLDSGSSSKKSKRSKRSKSKKSKKRRK